MTHTVIFLHLLKKKSKKWKIITFSKIELLHACNFFVLVLYSVIIKLFVKRLIGYHLMSPISDTLWHLS